MPRNWSRGAARLPGCDTASHYLTIEAVHRLRGSQISFEVKLARQKPIRRVVPRHQIPPLPLTHLEPRFWDSVVGHLKLLKADEVLQVEFRSRNFHPRMTSSVHLAAARAGLKVSVLIRGTSFYISIAGRRAQKRASTPRQSITCAVCAKTVIKPRTGGSRQEVCAGEGGRKSRCQEVRDYARKHRIPVAQAKSRLLDARCEVCGTPIQPVGRQVVCGPKPGEQRSECQATKNLAQVNGITIKEAKERRARFRSRTEARRKRRAA